MKPIIVRAAISCLVVASLVGCGSGPVTSTAPGITNPSAGASPVESSAAPEPAQSAEPEPTVPVALQGVLPGDLFVAAADPLNLTTTLDEDHAATESIGWDGGSVSATGGDGTKYTLTIPAGALPMEIPITVTPISSVSGFPEGATPEHNIGVILSPDGLPLGETASLSIEATSALPADSTVALTYKGTGEDAAFQVFDVDGSSARIQIDHFSGYQIAFPIYIADTRPSDIQRYMTQNEVERQLASEIADGLTTLRQMQIRGRDPGWSARDVALYVLPIFKRLVISRRVAVADQSCANANAAMEAYLEYQRTRQLLGVADDPAFDLIGAGLFVPQDLVDLAVQVCFKEAYESCKRTGDFPALAVYYLSFFRQVTVMGADVNPEYVSLAQDYLGKCGRWRVRFNVTIQEPEYVDVRTYQNESTREFYIQWKPGDGTFGIGGSTIEGSGPVDTTKVAYINGACTPRIYDQKSVRDATARMVVLAYDHFEIPIVRVPVPGVPAKMALAINLGETFHRHQCMPNGAEEEYPEQFGNASWVVALVQGQTPGLEQLIAISKGDGTITIDRGWHFSMTPFKASNVVDGIMDLITGQLVSAESNSTTYDRLEAIVEHEPL